MIYTPEEKSRIESLLTEAADYINGIKYVDFGYSPKVGYIYMDIDDGNEILTTQELKSFDDVLLCLLHAAAFDVRSVRLRNGDESCNLYPFEGDTMRNILTPVFERLSSEADRKYCMAMLAEYIDEFYDEHLQSAMFICPPKKA